METQDNKFIDLVDEALVTVVREGNIEIYEELVNRYQDKLLRYVNRLIQDQELSQDVVQETFVKAFINLNGFNTKKKFSSWVYRIAHNEAINHVKKERRNLKQALSGFFEEILPGKDDIERNYEKEELAQEIQGCLDKLDIKYSEPLALYFLEDKSYDEISDILRLPIGTVGTRINRGKKLLKENYERKS